MSPVWIIAEAQPRWCGGICPSAGGPEGMMGIGPLVRVGPRPWGDTVISGVAQIVLVGLREEHKCCRSDQRSPARAGELGLAGQSP